MLITDHNVRETLGICDRAYIVNDGKIIAAGSPQSVLDDEGYVTCISVTNFTCEKTPVL